MADRPSSTGQKLTRQAISDRVTGLGWRYNLGLIRASIKVGSVAQAADLAQAVTALAAQDGDSLSADLRRDRVILTLQSRADAWVTEREIDLAGRISARAGDRGLATEAEVGSGAPRSVQVLEIGIDALDIPASGTLVYDAEAPAFWVLADPEGNEACVCTWHARDD